MMPVLSMRVCRDRCHQPPGESVTALLPEKTNVLRHALSQRINGVAGRRTECV